MRKAARAKTSDDLKCFLDTDTSLELIAECRTDRWIIAQILLRRFYISKQEFLSKTKKLLALLLFRGRRRA